MSRTWKVTDDWRTKSTNSNLQMGCGRGKGCGVCGDLTRYSDKVRAAIAAEKVEEYEPDETFPYADQDGEWTLDDDYPDRHDRCIPGDSCDDCAMDWAERETEEEWLASFPIYILNPWDTAPQSYL